MNITTTNITITNIEATTLGMLEDLLVDCLDWDNMSQKDIELVDKAGEILSRLWKEGRGH